MVLVLMMSHTIFSSSFLHPHFLPPNNAFTLNSNGNVGIGTDNPDHKLEVKGDAKIGGYFYFGDESTDGSWRIGEDGDGLLSFEKRVDGSWIKKMEMN